MKTKLIATLLLTSLFCGGCNDAVSSNATRDVAAPDNPAPAAAEAAVSKITIVDTPAPSIAKPATSPAPIAEKNRIISKAPSQGRADSGCAFVIRYAGTEEQPLIREGDGECKTLDAQFIAVSKLEEMGQLDDLSPVDAANIRKSPGGTVFYIEEDATSSAYPLGDGDIAYEVVLAD